MDRIKIDTMKYLAFTLLSIVALSSSCEDAESSEAPQLGVSNRQITIDQARFEEAWSSVQTDDPISDPFELRSLSFFETTLVIGVSYSGGCQEHGFELIWPEVTTMIYPPRYTVILNHNSKDDWCEAYPSDTLHFDLASYNLGITPELMNVIDLTIVNGSNGAETLKLNN